MRRSDYYGKPRVSLSHAGPQLDHHREHPGPGAGRVQQPASQRLVGRAGDERSGRAVHGGPKIVGRGEADVCMTTPTWYGEAAHFGRFDFDRPYDVKAIATFPHDDRLAFAVRKETGITSLHDLREKKYPLRVAIPSSRQLHPAGLIAEEALAQYGVTLRDIEAWGGAVLPRIS